MSEKNSTLMEMFKMYAKQCKTIPNILSFIRILLTPVCMVLLLKGNPTDKMSYYIAAFVLVIFMGVTDFLDGKIARRFNQTTDLGKILDPTADKITQFGIATVLIIRYWSWANWGFILLFSVYIVKEILQIIASLLILARGYKPTQAQMLGKVSTFVFYIVVVVIFAFGEGGVFSGYWNMYRSAPWLMYILLIISCGFMVAAFCSYIPDFKKGMKYDKSMGDNYKLDDNEK